ncbi:UDP-N-acetylglucosamine--N-acetylmuramyl-(pentapeptide) pyrophosphoryl-undecaprenol N-acetylglucosamine transferase [Luteimonas panaciterrae]|uniref:UDP-N-acetylglucosamine--N-acetylmuramyl- (pentapeptide) pyrophosphoryl-undecaprenol N-acetylglucosamine transferase n=1 Tax=Luteimonas panaciterrae TaxID=363885 RepID=UPI001CF99563|nr:UDP-N-acetylglucosamine--N-acetylmuramyl-(pentapeptide) pyrophosphoryl-undecaprenol N-acetylglucosamine transferase [Luteimonas panaciterrae]
MTQPARNPDVTSRTIGLAAGGTGGHLFPAEALARELLARGHQVVIYTERRGAAYTKALEGLPYVVLPARSLAGGLIGKLAAALTIARAAWQARRDMKRRGVALVAGFGGYPSFAPAVAAKIRGLPLLLHEQATQLSMANRQLLRFADALAISFPRVSGAGGFDAANIVETGNPVRRDILAARAPYPALSMETPLHLLVVGGSQSARVFGETVPPALLALPEQIRRRLHVSLQYKGDDTDAITARLREAGVEATIRPFFEDMGARLAQAHLVITRAGASTAADLLTVGRPAIFVPIPQGGSREEQRRNAETMAAAGAGWCVMEPDLSVEALTALLAELFASDTKLPQAAAVASTMARPQAAANLADQVERMLAARGAK